MPKITEKDYEFIKEMYLDNNMTCADIWRTYYSDYYKSSAMVERIVREELKISKGSNHWNKTIMNHNYFEIIDDERKAYWLGFIMADGSVANKNGMNKKVLSISIVEKDSYLLNEFARDIKSDKTCKTYHRTENGKERHMSVINIHSSKMFDDLERYNVIPRKSFHDLPMPTEIPDELMHHYIRGYFDGDGCIYRYKPNDQNKYRGRVSICVTESFGANMVDVLYKYGVLNKINPTNLLNYERYGVNIFHLRVDSVKDVERFCYYIYKDATVFMKRKKEIFDLLF